MVPDFVRLGFTAEIPLPNQGFPARFLAGHRRRKDSPQRIGEPDSGILPSESSALLIPTMIRPSVIT